MLLTFLILSLPPEQLELMESWGYPGVFLLSLLSNATLFLPAPGLLIVFAFATKLPPVKVAIFAAIGATLGELSGFIAGYSGQGIISNNKIYQKMVSWTDSNGPITVMVLAFLPNPFFDLTGIAAGALKMPIGTFLIWAFIGKFFKMLITAFAGAGFFSNPWIISLFNQT